MNKNYWDYYFKKENNNEHNNKINVLVIKSKNKINKLKVGVSLISSLLIFYLMIGKNLSLNKESPIEKDIYKNYSSPILELEKIIKSILKEIVDKFKESKMTRKATAVNDFVELDEINNIKDIKIIELLLDKKSKKICIKK